MPLGVGPGHSALYVGLVRLSRPPSRGDLLVSDVQTLGLGADQSAFLGWRHSRLVYVKPDDCRVIILLQHRLELEHVENLLKSMGEKPCVVDYTHSLPHP